MTENSGISITFSENPLKNDGSERFFIDPYKLRIEALEAENEDLKKRLKKVEWHINILYMKAAQTRL